LTIITHWMDSSRHLIILNLTEQILKLTPGLLHPGRSDCRGLYRLDIHL